MNKFKIEPILSSDFAEKHVFIDNNGVEYPASDDGWESLKAANQTKWDDQITPPSFLCDDPTPSS